MKSFFFIWIHLINKTDSTVIHYKWIFFYNQQDILGMEPKVQSIFLLQYIWLTSKTIEKMSPKKWEEKKKLITASWVINIWIYVFDLTYTRRDDDKKTEQEDYLSLQSSFVKTSCYNLFSIIVKLVFFLLLKINISSQNDSSYTCTLREAAFTFIFWVSLC